MSHLVVNCCTSFRVVFATASPRFGDTVNVPDVNGQHGPISATTAFNRRSLGSRFIMTWNHLADGSAILAL